LNEKSRLRSDFEATNDFHSRKSVRLFGMHIRQDDDTRHVGSGLPLHLTKHASQRKKNFTGITRSFIKAGSIGNRG
jgi:hypothetical protein